MITRLVCTKCNTPITKKPTKNKKIHRIYCPECGKFIQRKNTIMQTAQEIAIAKRLKTIDLILKEIWKIAYEHKDFPTLERKGLMDYGLGDMFIAVHMAQDAMRRGKKDFKLYDFLLIQEGCRAIRRKAG